MDLDDLDDADLAQDLSDGAVLNADGVVIRSEEQLASNSSEVTEAAALQDPAGTADNTEKAVEGDAGMFIILTSTILLPLIRTSPCLFQDAAAVASSRPASRRHVDKNSQYRQMLLEEDRRHRREKTAGSSVLDLEADEEEEEGLQAGLGDFGFGKIANKDDDEQVCVP